MMLKPCSELAARVKRTLQRGVALPRVMPKANFSPLPNLKHVFPMNSLIESPYAFPDRETIRRVSNLCYPQVLLTIFCLDDLFRGTFSQYVSLHNHLFKRLSLCVRFQIPYSKASQFSSFWTVSQ